MSGNTAEEHWLSASLDERRPFLEDASATSIFSQELTQKAVAISKDKQNNFNEFCREQKAKVMASNPGISVRSAIKILEEMWKSQNEI